MMRHTFIKAAAFSIASTCLTAYGTGVPVVDALNNINTKITSMESLKQTVQLIDQVNRQIQQYQTQLNQFETQKNQYTNMIKNTKNLDHFTWDDSKKIINKILQLQDQIAYYEQQSGSLNQWLDQYQDSNYYRSNPCFNGSSCTEAELNKLYEKRRVGSTAQKKANDALFEALKNQQETLKGDAQQLADLQNSATSADGQMKAIQAANQLAGQQSNQLLQIRSILLAQQNAMAVKYQQELDRQAQEQAAMEQARKGSFVSSSGKEW